MSTRPSVLVVGAGPVGLATAVELARRGAGVRIVDKDPLPTSESRAIAVNPRTLGLLEPCGATERVIAAGVRLRGLRVVSAGVTRAAIDVTRLPPPYNFMVTLPQNQTAEILAEVLRAQGVEVEHGVAATVVTTNPSGAEVTLEKPSGQEHVVVDWLVGADGAHSTVRKALGIGFPGEPYPFQWSLADIDLAGDAEEDRGELRLDVRAPILVRLPLGRGRHRLISNAPDLLDRVPASWAPGVVHWRNDFRVSHRQVDRLGRDRAWLIGDAAHIHSPAGGRGMNLGIEDGVTLAERIAAGDLGDWAARRHAKAAVVLRETDRMQRLATADGAFMRSVAPRVVGALLRVPALHDRLIRSVAGGGDPRCRAWTRYAIIMIASGGPDGPVASPKPGRRRHRATSREGKVGRRFAGRAFPSCSQRLRPAVSEGRVGSNRSDSCAEQIVEGGLDRLHSGDAGSWLAW